MGESDAVDGEPGPWCVRWTVMFGWKCVLLQRTELANIATTDILTNRHPHVPPVDSGGQCIVGAGCSWVLKLKMNAANKG